MAQPYCWIRCCYLLVALLLLRCAGEPSPIDRQRLELLNARFDGKYAFALDGELYLSATARDSAVPSRTDMQAAYRAFAFDENGRRRNTTFVYLNVYDSQGDFLYQVAFDPRRGSFIEGRREHY